MPLRKLICLCSMGALQFILSCSTDEKVTTPETPAIQYTEKKIGPAGGTMSDSTGMSISVPAGALAAATTISAGSYSSSDAFAAKYPATPFGCGAVECLPSGLTFSAPVVITIPLFGDMAIDSASLFFRDTVNNRWEYAGPALVDTSAGIATAQVSHFTTYAVFAFPAKWLEFFEEYLQDGSDPQGALSSYAAWVESTTGIYGQQRAFRGCCYRVSGIAYDVQYSIGGTGGSVQKQTGEQTAYTNTFSQRSFHSSYTSSDGKEIVFSMLVTLSLKCEVVPTLTAQKTTLKKDESTPVTATFPCGPIAFFAPVSGVTAGFAVSGPGRLDRTNVQVGSDGTATVNVTATDTGTITVTMNYGTCPCENCNEAKTVSTAILVPSTAILWRITVDAVWKNASFDYYNPILGRTMGRMTISDSFQIEFDVEYDPKQIFNNYYMKTICGLVVKQSQTSVVLSGSWKDVLNHDCTISSENLNVPSEVWYDACIYIDSSAYVEIELAQHIYCTSGHDHPERYLFSMDVIKNTSGSGSETWTDTVWTQWNEMSFSANGNDTSYSDSIQLNRNSMPTYEDYEYPNGVLYFSAIKLK